ncbi:uncharacterized protein TNCV_1853031 [Trichonephila clavipes]|nr:uncharacterized protein TNCV_1853031 [Trichonephila clavipes]
MEKNLSKLRVNRTSRAVSGRTSCRISIKSRWARPTAAFGDKSPSRATVFRWFKEFCRGRNSFQDEEHTGRTRSAVIPDNVYALRKMLMDDNRCTYQMIQKDDTLDPQPYTKLFMKNYI